MKLSVQESARIIGVQRLSSLLSSFQSGLSDDAVALQALLDTNQDFSSSGTTPAEIALHRTYDAISAVYDEVDSYLAGQAVLPIDPACYTDLINCKVAKLVEYKLSDCAGQRTNQLRQDWEDIQKWLKDVHAKRVTLILNDCPGQTVEPNKAKGRFGYISGDRQCSFRYSKDCVTDDCGKTTVNVRTGVQDTRFNQGSCCNQSAENVSVNNRPAGENIPAFKVVSVINGQLFITDPTNTLSAHSVIGIAKENIAMAEQGNIQFEGEITNALWNFTSTTGMLFVSLSGDVTDIPPTTGWSIDFGSITSPNSAFIDIDEVQLVA